MGLSMGVLPDQNSKACATGTMTLKEVATAENLQIIDARSADEFSFGHHAKAKNIPIDEFQSRMAELGNDKKAPIIIHCARGARAGSCVRIALDSGFVNVFCAANQSEVEQLLASCGSTNLNTSTK